MSWRLDSLEQENKKLKLLLDQREREARELRRSLFALSAQHAAVVRRVRAAPAVDVDSILAGVDEAETASLENAQSAWASSLVGMPALARQQSRGGGALSAAVADGAPLHFLHDLSGHKAAVYAAVFGQRGKWVASASFDRTVRLWDLGRPSREEHVETLRGHQHTVSDVGWHAGMQHLVSGAFDHTVRLWAVQAAGAHTLQTFTVPGGAFVQKVAFASEADPTLVLAATSGTALLAYDSRAPPGPPAFALENSSMINSFAVERDGVVITGDRRGDLKVWDTRALACAGGRVNSQPLARPVSHVEASPPSTDMPRGRYLAVNSYDDVLRVYDRGDGGPTAEMTLVHALEGHQSRNWPIRSSLFIGANFHRALPARRRSNPGDGPAAVAARDREAASARDLDEEEEDARGTQPFDATMLAATGSTDGLAYVYDVGGGRNDGQLVQRLAGHRGRVHAVSFHFGDQPRLATCSADGLIKIWGAKSDHYRHVA